MEPFHQLHLMKCIVLIVVCRLLNNGAVFVSMVGIKDGYTKSGSRSISTITFRGEMDYTVESRGPLSNFTQGLVAFSLRY